MSGESGDHNRSRFPSTKPPRNAERLLLYFLPDEVRDCVAGDLAEIYETVVLPSSSIVRSHFWYWRQVFSSLRLFLRYRKNPQPTLEFWKGRNKMDVPRNHEVAYHRGISMHKIPVEGAAGLIFVFATLFIFGVGIPAVRGLLVITGTFGMLGSGVLYYWHKRHALKIGALNLHGSASSDGRDRHGDLVGKPCSDALPKDNAANSSDGLAEEGLHKQ
jgi:hypothetical protein